MEIGDDPSRIVKLKWTLAKRLGFVLPYIGEKFMIDKNDHCISM